MCSAKKRPNNTAFKLKTAKDRFRYDHLNIFMSIVSTYYTMLIVILLLVGIFYRCPQFTITRISKYPPMWSAYKAMLTLSQYSVSGLFKGNPASFTATTYKVALVKCWWHVALLLWHYAPAMQYLFNQHDPWLCCVRLLCYSLWMSASTESSFY